MPVDASTVALKAELQAPTVLVPRDFADTAKAYRPHVAQLSAQVSRLQQLLAVVEEDETAAEVLGKLEALRQNLRALDRQTTAAEKAHSILAQTYRLMVRQTIPDIVAAIERNE